MRTNPYREAVFPQTITRAVANLKARLQHDYEQAYPNLAEIIHIVLDEEEAKAWELSFPHLFLPDLVEAHIAKLNLPPADTKHDDVIVPHDFTRVDATLAHVAASQTVFSRMQQPIIAEETPYFAGGLSVIPTGNDLTTTNAN